MGILFSAVAETPYAHAWHDWARLTLSTLGTMIALRNLLVSMYEASGRCMGVNSIELDGLGSEAPDFFPYNPCR